MSSNSHCWVPELRPQTWSPFHHTISKRMLCSCSPSCLTRLLLTRPWFQWSRLRLSAHNRCLLTKVLHDRGARHQEGRNPTRMCFCSPHSIGAFWRMSCPRHQRNDWCRANKKKCFAKCCLQIQNLNWWWGLGKEIWFLILFQSLWIKKPFVSTPLYSIMGRSKVPLQTFTNPPTDLFYSHELGALYRQAQSLTAHSCHKFFTH